MVSTKIAELQKKESAMFFVNDSFSFIFCYFSLITFFSRKSRERHLYTYV